MTVVWRLMDLTKTNVLWKGKSVGYGEVEDGEYNGEIVLIERAFADAVDNLRNLPGLKTSCPNACRRKNCKDSAMP